MKSKINRPRTNAGKALHAGRLRQRTHQRVRAGSFHHDPVIEGRWASTNRFPRSENNARLRAAEAYEHLTKQPGARNGKLGHIGIEVFRFFLRLRGRKDGRLDPSYSWIAQQIRRSRSAVVSAVARLKAEGFLESTRRTRPVENPEPGGQYVEQISNAYFLSLPAKAMKLVARITRNAVEAAARSLTAVERDARQDRANREAAATQPAILAKQQPNAPSSMMDAIRSLGNAVDRRDEEANRASPQCGRNETL